ncbi:MAG: cache domain-containing protein, partial [Cyanobacteria bacterium J06576_12]
KVSLEVTATIDKQVRSYLLEPSIITAAVESEIASGNINIDNTAELGEDFWQFTQSVQLAQSLYYGNETGEFVYSKYQADKGRIDLRDQSTNFQRTPYYTDDKGNIAQPFADSEYDKATYDKYDHRQRGWYQDTAEAKAATWSNVYQASGTGQLTITRAMPILNANGVLEGVLGTDIYLSELSDFLKDLDLSSNARTFIIDSEDNLIAISSDQKLDVSAAVDSLDLIVQATARNLLADVTTFDNIEQQHIFRFELEGETQLAHVYRLQEQGINWLIGVTIPQKEYMSDIHASAWQTFMLGGAITLGASLLALSAALNIIRPINRLTQAAEDIKHNQFIPGDLDDVIARPDEFSELATLFNDMATVVVSREQGLSEQVARLKTERDQGETDSDELYSVKDIVAHARQMRSADP